MKANELMIGDLLYDKANDYYGEVTGVIDNGEIYIDGVIAYIDDCTPIPLTSEILEKNGFVKAPMVSDTPPYDKDEEGNMHFSLNESFWGWWQPNNTFLIPANGLGWLELKYVHELQHALRLCGIDKTIEL